MAILGNENTSPANRYDLAAYTQVAIGPFTTTTGGWITNIKAWVKKPDDQGSTTVSFGVWANDGVGGAPKTLKGLTPTYSVSKNGEVVNGTLATALPVLPNTTFYIGVAAGSLGFKVGAGNQDGTRWTYRSGTSNVSMFTSASASTGQKLSIWALFQENNAPGAPSNPTPANGGSITTANPAFAADCSVGTNDLSAGDAIEYGRWEIKTAAGAMVWSGVVPNSLSGNRVGWTYFGNPLQPGVSYTWRVQGIDKLGLAGPWSNAWTFSYAGTGGGTEAAVMDASYDPSPTGKVTAEPDALTWKARWTHTSKNAKYVRVLVYTGTGANDLFLTSDWHEKASGNTPGSTVSVTSNNVNITKNKLPKAGSYWYGMQAKTNDDFVSPLPHLFAGGLWPFAFGTGPQIPTDLQPTDARVSIPPTLSWICLDPDEDAVEGVNVDWQVELTRTDTSPSQTTTYTTSAYDADTQRASLDLAAASPSLPNKGTFKWRVRGRTSGVPGPWSDVYGRFELVEGPKILVTVPTAGQVFATSTPTIAYTVTANGPLVSYKVSIYERGSSAPVYDSGWIGGSPGSHLVPAGYLVNQKSYEVEVSGLNGNDKEGRSPRVAFAVSYAPPRAVDAVWCEKLRGGGDVEDTAVLVSWTPGPLDATSFASYVVKRTVVGGAASEQDVIAARVTARNQTTWIDWHAPAGLPLVYTLFVATGTGAAEVLSTGVAADEVELALSCVVITSAQRGGSARAILRWKPATRSGEWTQQQQVYTTWGSRGLPTVFYGAGTQSVVDASFKLVNDADGDRHDYWRNLRDLFAAQEIVSYRDERQRFFGRIAKLSYDMEDNSDDVSLRIEQVAFTEGA